jgi:hypothetical protein
MSWTALLGTNRMVVAEVRCAKRLTGAHVSRWRIDQAFETSDLGPTLRALCCRLLREHFSWAITSFHSARSIRK